MPTYNYLGDGNPDGTIIGQSASEKIGFYGATPVVQASAITTTGSTSPSMKTRINSILTVLRNLGIIAT